jgi:hypothetical protein
MNDPDDAQRAWQAAPTPRDPDETARFLREQPPIVVPRRSFETGRQPPGLIVYRLLGYRVITRYET